MKEATSKKDFSLAKQLAFTAVFAALCCVSTWVISIPLPSSGYFNTGDVFVLLSGWLLGPLYGPVAAAVGSAIADVLVGAPIYAPATFLIKGLLALIAYMVCACMKKLVKKNLPDFVARGISAIPAEAVMVLGYFLYEWILSGSFTAGVPNILGNCLQALCCLILATALLAALRPIPAVRKFFPALQDRSAQED